MNRSLTLLLVVLVASLATWLFVVDRAEPPPVDRAHGPTQTAIDDPADPAAGGRTGAEGDLGPGDLPFDLGAVMEQVRLAFRSEARGTVVFEGGGDSYGVRFDEDGLAVRALSRAPVFDPAPDPRRQAVRREASAAEAGGPPETPPVVSEPLRLRTERVGRRGGWPLGAPTVEVEGDGHLALTRSDHVEHLRNTPGAMEQSWEFPSLPRGEGDLVVRIAASGLPFVGATHGGLHFADATGLGVRYGHATWVDASGVRTAVPARWDGGAIELRVAEVTLMESVYPAVLDPLIGPELDVDEPVAIPEQATEYNVAAASNGTEYLVVWEHRDLLYGPSHIYGTRVLPDGTPVDVPAFRIDPAASYSAGMPTIAWNGSNYLVAWSNRTDASSADAVWGARLGSDGTILDPDAIAIHDLTPQSLAPAVASNGSDYLVAFVHDAPGRIWGARVSGDGEVLDPSGFEIRDSGIGCASPVVASNGTNYLVAWVDGATEILATRVGSDGSLLDAGPIDPSGSAVNQDHPALASDGLDFLVVWEESGSGTSLDVLAARIGADGGVLGIGAFPVVALDQTQHQPAVAWGGDTYLVAWRDYPSSKIYGARVSTDGTVQDPGGVQFCTPVAVTYGPTVASDGTDFLVVWHESRSSAAGTAYDVLAVSIDGSTGWPVHPTPHVLGLAYNEQTYPSIAALGDEYLVVWVDDRSWGGDVYGVRLAADGTVLDPAAIWINRDAEATYRPKVVSNGAEYFVVWEKEGFDVRGNPPTIHLVHFLRGTRVTADGTVLSPWGVGLVGSTTSTRKTSVTLAAGGEGYLIVWEAANDIQGLRVGWDGFADGAQIPICTNAAVQGEAAVASDGDAFLVAWSDSRTNPSALYTTFVLADGTVVTPNGAPLLDGGVAPQHAPTLTFNGDMFYVAFTASFVGPPATRRVFAARIAPDGTALDPLGVELSPDAGYADTPSVATVGQDLLVVWRDRQNAGVADDTPDDRDLYGARLGFDGSVLDAPVIEVGPLASDQFDPLVASTGADSALVVYRRSMFESWRLFSRTLRWLAFGESCGAADECASGVCIDGACATHCGDGVLEDGEACDDGASNSDTEPGACRQSCSLPSCGDGVVDPPEVCDPGASGSSPCNATCDALEAIDGGVPPDASDGGDPVPVVDGGALGPSSTGSRGCSVHGVLGMSEPLLPGAWALLMGALAVVRVRRRAHRRSPRFSR